MVRACAPVLAALAATALGAPVAAGQEVAGWPGGSAPLVVDGPPAVECPDARFSTIGAAVAAAPAGATIKVCPGLYHENVDVAKPVTLAGPRRKEGAPVCPADAAGDPMRDAIVDSQGAGDGVRLRANGAALDALVVQGNLRGIVTDPAYSGYSIRRTVVQDNDVGIAFGSSGALESAVERSCLRASGVGLSAFSLKLARLHGNELTGNGYGMALVSSAGVSVLQNELSDSSLVGIFVSLGTDVSVRHNDVTRSGSAIVYDTSTGEIADNEVEHADDEGIALLSAHDLVVRANEVRWAGIGLQLLEADDNTLRRNTVEDSAGDGIVLDGAHENTLSDNVSDGNGGDGLRVTADARGNTLRKNELLSNRGYDCRDASLGAGTAGTANVWLRNVGLRASPAAVCGAG